MSALTVCLQPHCPRPASSGGRCAGHQHRRMSSRPWRRLVAQVLRRDHARCWLCGEAGATTADHIVRVRDGGADTLANLRACHVECNRRRG